jgi:hypothetical protein
MLASKGMRNFFDQLHHFWGELQILGFRGMEFRAGKMVGDLEEEAVHIYSNTATTSSITELNTIQFPVVIKLVIPKITASCGELSESVAADSGSRFQ